MNWIIEGSNSDSSNDWTVLDSMNNITSLDESNAGRIFSIQKTNEFYRYLRIRQTGKDSSESIQFSQSEKFSKTSQFSESTKFTDSLGFTKSKKFTKSFYFSSSEKFTRANFTIINIFKII